MNLNVMKWKEYKLEDVFKIIPGQYHYPEEYDCGMTPYVSASNTYNGVTQYIDLSPDFKGNCIITGKVGCTAFYQPNDFCATSDVNILYPKNFILNRNIGMFFVTIINLSENYKWSYGRQCRVGDSNEIIIKLPTVYNANGKPKIDSNLKFSPLGYIIDFEFMEKYIQALNYKKITTKINTEESTIPIDKWIEFSVDEIFTILNGKGITKEEIECNPGDFNAIQSSEFNNGLMGKIDMDYCKNMGYTLTEKPCLTVARTGSAGFISYQEFGCVVGDSAKILLLKNNDKYNTYVYLFLRTILMATKYKYTYGRKVTKNKYSKEKIKLPAILNNDKYLPDWDYMETYIKNLPYGDRI